MKTITCLCAIALTAGLGLGAMVSGCAGVGLMTPKAATVASGAVTVAQGLLHALDGFYGDLVELKTVPDNRVEATRALAMADFAAVTLRQVIAGASVSDEQLNVAAGAVDGSRAILETVKK